MHGRRRFTYQPSAYLWHCCGYILFTALVSEVWEPPSPATPTGHPPIVTAICAGAVLPGKGHGWWNPLQIENLEVWNQNDTIYDTKRNSFQSAGSKYSYSITTDSILKMPISQCIWSFYEPLPSCYLHVRSFCETSWFRMKGQVLFLVCFLSNSGINCLRAEAQEVK